VLSYHLNVNHLGNISVAQMYVSRSMKNVDDSDATLAFRLKESKGTDLTIGYCLTKKWKVVGNYNVPTRYKPCLVISDLSDESNSIKIKSFILSFDIRILNIAGHRDEVVHEFSQKIKALLMETLHTFKSHT
jgi:hypothetical protein